MNKEATENFINAFVEKYKLCMPMDIFVDTSVLFDIIKKLNDDLKEKGFIVLSGRVNRKYLEEMIAVYRNL